MYLCTLGHWRIQRGGGGATGIKSDICWSKCVLAPPFKNRLNWTRLDSARLCTRGSAHLDSGLEAIGLGTSHLVSDRLWAGDPAARLCLTLGFGSEFSSVLSLAQSLVWSLAIGLELEAQLEQPVRVDWRLSWGFDSTRFSSVLRRDGTWFGVTLGSSWSWLEAWIGFGSRARLGSAHPRSLISSESDSSLGAQIYFF